MQNQVSSFKDLQKLQANLAEMRKKTDVGHIQEMEVKREQLGEEVNSKKFELALQRSSFDNMRRLENKEKKRKKYGPVFWGNPVQPRKIQCAGWTK